MAAGAAAVDRADPGTTTLSRLGENIGTADITLDADALQCIAVALNDIRIVGDRYPPPLQARINR